MKKLLLAAVLALTAGLLWAPAALARNLADDQVVVGESYTLGAGQIINGNLIVLGGNATVEAGAEVTGNVVVFGGNVSLAGRVDQDLVVFGGNADLLSTAVVAGQLVTSGGSVSRAEGSEVRGGETQGVGPSLPWRSWVVTTAPTSPLDRLLAFLWNGLLTLVVAVVLSVLALLVVLLLPEPTARVSGAVAAAPVLSGGLGLLTLVAVPVLAVLLAVFTLLCLTPVSALVLLVYGVALLFGWLALGALLGERLAAALHWRSLSPVMAAGLGAFLLSLVVGIINLVPIMGPPLSFVAQLVLASIGLGAVTLTRFGTQPYLRASPPAPAAPAAPLAPPPAPAAPEPPIDPGL